MKPRRTSSSKALRLLAGMREIEFTISGKPYRFDLAKELRLSVGTAERALIHQAERAVFWARLSAEMHKAKRKIELALDEARAEHSLSVRERLPGATESRVSAEVRLQPNVMRLEREYNEASYNEELCRAVVLAFEHRRSAMMKLNTSKE